MVCIHTAEIPFIHQMQESGTHNIRYWHPVINSNWYILISFSFHYIAPFMPPLLQAPINEQTKMKQAPLSLQPFRVKCLYFGLENCIFPLWDQYLADIESVQTNALRLCKRLMENTPFSTVGWLINRKSPALRDF